jgi:hypothetical protein
MQGGPAKVRTSSKIQQVCSIICYVWVDKGNNTKAGFDKKIVAALSFIQMYINKHAAFFPIKGSDLNKRPIKEKADLPEFQVVLRSYFEIPNQRAFESMTQEGEKLLKGLQ